MLTNKDLDLLSWIHTNHEVSIKDLAEHFSLSERSIRYYINNINIELKDHGIQIKKGICFLQDQPYIEQYLNHPENTLLSSDMKKKIIDYHLVFHGYINITSLSEQLEISRSSTKSYVEEIKQSLLIYHLELKQEHKKGLILQGSEENIRKLQLHTLFDYHKLSQTNRNLLKPLLDEYCENIPEEQLHQFLQLVQKDLGIILSDDSYTFMYDSCLILVQRNLHYHILQSCDNEQFLSSCPEYQIVTKHCVILNQLIQSDLNHYERLQLTSLLIGSNYTKNNLLENNWFEHDLLVSKIINLFSDYYGMNLNKDRTLYENLLVHLQPTMYRLLNNIPISDMNYKEIQQKFPKEYEITKKVLHELNFFTSDTQDHDETALLTLHFKAAISRCEKKGQQKANVLIICSHGYGTSKLLEQQLIDTYEVNVLDCIPYHHLPQYEKLDKVNFIITTIDALIEFKKIPIIHVKPILDREEILKLDHSLLIRRKNKISMSLLLDTIKKSCTIHELGALKQNLQELLQDMIIRDDNKDQTLLDILPKENMLLHYHAENWREAIEAAGNLLIKNGYVHQRYKEQMLYSFENYGSYMIIDEGIAIPHAKNEGTVYKTGMTLIILDKPITFINGRMLQVFFSFCSKDNIEHLDALVAVANLIKETEFQKIVGRFQQPEDVISYIIMHEPPQV